MLIAYHMPYHSIIYDLRGHEDRAMTLDTDFSPEVRNATRWHEAAQNV